MTTEVYPSVCSKLHKVWGSGIAFYVSYTHSRTSNVFPTERASNGISNKFSKSSEFDLRVQEKRLRNILLVLQNVAFFCSHNLGYLISGLVSIELFVHMTLDTYLLGLLSKELFCSHDLGYIISGLFSIEIFCSHYLGYIQFRITFHTH